MYRYENREKLRRVQKRKASMSSSPFTNTTIYTHEPFLPAVRSKANVLASQRREQKYVADTEKKHVDQAATNRTYDATRPHIIPAVQKQRYNPQTGKFVMEQNSSQDSIGIASHEDNFTVPLRHATESQLIAELARRKITPAWVSHQLAERVMREQWLKA
jgi:hypothetical protein